METQLLSCRNLSCVYPHWSLQVVCLFASPPQGWPAVCQIHGDSGESGGPTLLVWAKLLLPALIFLSFLPEPIEPEWRKVLLFLEVSREFSVTVWAELWSRTSKSVLFSCCLSKNIPVLGYPMSHLTILGLLLHCIIILPLGRAVRIYNLVPAVLFHIKSGWARK